MLNYLYDSPARWFEKLRKYLLIVSVVVEQMFALEPIMKYHTIIDVASTSGHALGQ